MIEDVDSIPDIQKEILVYRHLTVKEGKKLIDCLEKENGLPKEEMAALISAECLELFEYARGKARVIADRQFGKDIYIRGLIEFTNYCKNDCYYCGICCNNAKAKRYRLSRDEIMACCWEGKSWDFVLLFYRVEKIHILTMTVL